MKGERIENPAPNKSLCTNVHSKIRLEKRKRSKESLHEFGINTSSTVWRPIPEGMARYLGHATDLTVFLYKLERIMIGGFT